MTDNSTAVANINKLGGTKCRACNYITKECWEIAQKFNSHLSASHIPGIHNSLADFKSRSYKESAEWMLDSTIFNKITNLWGVPDIDMFASHENFQCNTYVSWLPDPGAQFIDTFSISWETIFGYFFLRLACGEELWKNWLKKRTWPWLWRPFGQHNHGL